MSACADPACSNLTISWPEQYDDITGIGVTVNFMITGYLTILLIILNYLLVHDPEKSQFHDSSKRGSNLKRNATREKHFKPNPIDTMFLRSVRKIGRRVLLRVPTSISSKLLSLNFEHAFNEAIINMCDVQILTGGAILMSGFLSLKSGLSAYHWQVLVSLAWFSSVTHLAGVTTIRTYLLDYPLQRTIRFILMLSVLLMLVVAIVPTVFFNWGLLGVETITAYPNSPAVCYFDLKCSHALESKLTDLHHGEKYFALGLSSSQQNLLLSLLFIVFSVVAKTIKSFEVLSTMVLCGFRKPLRKVGHKILQTISPLSSTQYQSSQSRAASLLTFARILGFHMIFQPILSTFIAGRLLVDISNSMLLELHWLVFAVLWGTKRSKTTRDHLDSFYSRASSLRELPPVGNKWTFGQILPVMLLVIPVFNIVYLLLVKTKGSTNHHSDLSGTSTYHDWIDTTRHPSAPHEINVTDDIEMDAISSTTTLQSTTLVFETRTWQAGDAKHEELSDWAVRDYYQTSPWMGPIIISTHFSIIYVSILRVCLMPGLTDLFAPQPPIWAWMNYGVVGLLLAFPTACVFNLWLGLLLDGCRGLSERVHTCKALTFVLAMGIHVCYHTYDYLGPDWPLSGVRHDCAVYFVRFGLVTCCFLTLFSLFCVTSSVWKWWWIYRGGLIGNSR